MSSINLIKHFAKLTIIAVVLFPENIFACTGIILKAEDGSVVSARTLEFAVNANSEILFIPRKHAYTGDTPEGKNGMKWNSKYATIGANFFGTDCYIDAFNEKGLYGGTFYFPNYAKYQNVSVNDYSKTISETQVLSWALSNFENIKQVRENLKKIIVAGTFFKQMKEILPIHYIFSDTSGKSIVVEYAKGELNIYDNPFGVITNSPTFDWHVLNIANYLNLSTEDIPEKDIAGVEIKPFGQGSGLSGMPGDFTPPSRFIRALFFRLSSIKTKNSTETVMQAFHVLNSFDIPKGSIRNKSGALQSNDYTQWTSASDTKNKKYYYKTENNSRIRMADMNQLDQNGGKILRFKMETPEEDILNITENLE